MLTGIVIDIKNKFSQIIFIGNWQSAEVSLKNAACSTFFTIDQIGVTYNHIWILTAKIHWDIFYPLTDT